MDNSDAAGGAILLIVMLALGGVLYFLPSIIGRNKRNFAALFALNFLAGWTFIGWVAALVWALSADAPAVVRPVQAPHPAVVLCQDCGKYSELSGPFCTRCGAMIKL
jgi:hypothetical protein